MTLERFLHLEPAPEALPLDAWQPACCGEIAIVIERDGRWWHEGRPVENARVLRMLTRLLRRESDGHYYLVTPVEKWRIRVVSHPLVIVDAEWSSDDGGEAVCTLVTTTGERVTLDAKRRLLIDDQGLPFVPVRNGLSAGLARSLYYHLVERAGIVEGDNGQCHAGFESGGVWQSLGHFDGDETPSVPCS